MASNILSTDGAHMFKWTATGATAVNTLVIANATPVVLAEAATGSGHVVGAWVGAEATLTRKPGTAFTNGGRVFYVATGGVNKVTATAAAGKMVGYATAATTTGATSATVRLIAGPMPLETAT